MAKRLDLPARAGWIFLVLLTACSDPAPETPGAAAHFTIAEHGRLQVSRAALPKSDPLRLDLLLEDETRPPTRPVRVIEARGTRLDLEIVRTDTVGPPWRYRLDLPVSRLSGGPILIEVDAFDDHPLHLRRYVLEIQD